jgi:hypothetical protein
MLREGPIRRVRPRVYSVMRCRVSKFGGSGKRISGCTVRARSGDNFDFLFRATRDKVAARCFFEKLIAQNGAPETVTIDKSSSNLAALHAVNAERETPIKIRQVKYLNNVAEQDHRAIKRITRPDAGVQGFSLCARYSEWHRVDEHDQEGTDKMSWQDSVVSRTEDLLVCFVSNPLHIAYARLTILNTTEPYRTRLEDHGSAWPVPCAT